MQILQPTTEKKKKKSLVQTRLFLALLLLILIANCMSSSFSARLTSGICSCGSYSPSSVSLPVRAILLMTRRELGESRVMSLWRATNERRLCVAQSLQASSCFPFNTETASVCTFKDHLFSERAKFFLNIIGESQLTHQMMPSCSSFFLKTVFM